MSVSANQHAKQPNEPNVVIHCRQNSYTSSWFCEGTIADADGSISTVDLQDEKPVGLFLGCQERGRALVVDLTREQDIQMAGRGEPRVTLSNTRCLSKNSPLARK
ncbi:MAG: hypothetical protein OXG05_14450 [Gammaproteobacteria bacterium]|nr:hypothetical protein [Gammaproteobacteria bacterium]